MGSLYFWGCSIQEMSGNVVIGHSIFGVVVIDGSLYPHSGNAKTHTLVNDKLIILRQVKVFT